MKFDFLHLSTFSEVLKNEWDTARPVKANLESMGLVFDANRALKTKSTKRKYVEKLSKGVEAKEERDEDENRVSDEEEEVEENEVVGKLRDEAERSGKKSTFRLPAEDVRLEPDNYCAMWLQRSSGWHFIGNLIYVACKPT